MLAKIVFSGFVTACLFAGTPTSRYPSSVKATIEGVVLYPSEFSITFVLFPSMIATHEFVVPKSIPIIVEKFLWAPFKALKVFYFFKSVVNILLLNILN